MPASRPARRKPPSAASCAASASRCYIEACGIAPSAAVGSLGAGVGLWESAEVRVNPVGTIEVLTGAHRHGQGHETTFAQLVNDRFGIADRQHLDRPWRHRQGAVRHGHLRLAHRPVGMSAIVKALDKVEAKAKKIAAHLLEAVGSRHRHRERRAEGRRHRQAEELHRDRARRLHRPQPAAGHGAGPEGGRLLRSDQLHLPGRLLHLRGRGRSRDRQDRDRPVRRGRRFRQRHQSDDRRGPGPWRHRARHRPGAAREAPCTTAAGQLVSGSLHGLHHAARRRPAVVQGVEHRHALPEQSARHEGLRRGRRHRFAAGGDQRDHRRHRQQRSSMPATPEKVWLALAQGRDEDRRPSKEDRDVRDPLSPPEEPRRGGQALRRRRRRPLPRRRPDADPDHEAAPGGAVRPHRPRAPRRS